MSDVREEVRARYAEAARAVADQSQDAAAFESCCDTSCCGSETVFGSGLYKGLGTEVVPDAALLASLGCGNPTAVAEMAPGETVLDLGAGGGLTSCSRPPGSVLPARFTAST